MNERIEIKKFVCNVLIIGGGPAGATAARELNKQGIENILLEKDFSFKKPCGGGLMLRAFAEFEIPESLIQKRVKKIKIVSPQEKEAEVDISQTPLTVVNRQEFDAALRQMAQQGGTKMIEAKAYNIEVGENIKVRARSYTDEIEIEAKYIIAADGVNSLIRKRLRHETPARVLTHYIDIEDVQTDSCQFWFGKDIAPGHYAWIFPHHQGVNIGVCCDDPKEISSCMDRFLNKAGVPPHSNTKVKGYFIPQWEREVYYEQGVFFVGDSASMVLPFTYEGIYYAMKSAVMAVEAIAKDEPLLYEKRWKTEYAKKFRFLKLLQKIFLRSDKLSEKMVSFYQNPSFQKSVTGYWMGTKEPVGTARTLWKVMKLLGRKYFW